MITVEDILTCRGNEELYKLISSKMSNHMEDFDHKDGGS